MSADNEKLWVVTRHKLKPGYLFPISDNVPFKVFRTRLAARKYAKDMTEKAKRYGYYVDGVTWGPEQ